jgi:hypothetical protein
MEENKPIEIYEVYKDFSDQFYQDYESLGYFHNKKRALKQLNDVLKEKENITDDEAISSVDEIYEVDYVGCYGIQLIQVNTEEG